MTRFEKNLRAGVVRLVLPSARSIRVAAFAMVAFGLLALASARSVYADVREIALGVGHQLGSFEDLTRGAYLIHLNGADVYRSSAVTRWSPKEVLDRYQSYCQSSPSVLGRAMSDIPKALEERVELPPGDPLRWGVVREEREDRGMVACFVDDTATAASLRERLKAFQSTHDLAVFGQFRYVFVEKRPSGESRVVTIWTDGSLNVDTMFPKSGDVPGADSEVVPRPKDSRRTFNAYVDGYPAAVRIYESSERKEAVETFFDSQFSSKGFTKVRNGESVAYVGQDGTEVFVALHEDGARTIASIVEAGRASTLEVRGGEP